ncbi:MAG TPA: hypothetical protein VFB21_25135 [Chthonomonadaceae bacterium]|nr:hypothetical protein [Chthonomonadaceae bacterium]
MQSKRILNLPAVMALISCLFLSQQAVAWYCEGRLCSTALGCCCATPVSGSRDSQCASSPHEDRAVSACPAGCNCVRVVAARTPAAIRQPASAHPPVVAQVPLLPSLFVAPPCTTTVTHTVETRGPPLLSVTLATPSLRAPPAA